MKLKAKIERANKLVSEFRALMEDAKLPEDIDSSAEASKKYDKVFKSVSDIFSGNSNPESSIAKVYEHYLQYEKHLFLSLYHCYTCDYSTGKMEADCARCEIHNTLRVIDSSHEIEDTETFEFLALMDIKMRSAEIAIEARLIEPDALEAMSNADNNKAFDMYNQMILILKKSYEYNKNAPLEWRYIRTAKAKKNDAKANLAQVYVNITLKRISNNEVYNYDLTNDLLKYRLNQYEFLIKADNTNPLTNKYKIKANAIKKNIHEILEDNKKKWPIYAKEFQDNPIFLSLMEPEGTYNKEQDTQMIIKGIAQLTNTVEELKSNQADDGGKYFFTSIPRTQGVHHDFYKNIGENNFDTPKSVEPDKTIDWKKVDQEFFKTLSQRLKYEVVINKREKGKICSFIDDVLEDEQFGKILFSNTVGKKINWIGKKARPEILYFIWLLTDKYKIIEYKSDVFFENIPCCFKFHGEVRLKDKEGMGKLQESYYGVKRPNHLNEKTKEKLEEIITITAKEVHRHYVEKR